MNLSQIKRTLMVALVVVLMLGVVGLALSNVSVVAADTPAPAAGSVRGSFQTTSFLAATGYTTTTTAYTAASRPTYWYQGDLFVTADVSGTASVTVTPQFSADNVNWADAYFTYPALTLATTTSVITSTGLTTATTTASGSTAIASGVPHVVLSADGSDYSQFTLVGEYLRFKVVADNFSVATDRITVTVKATVKNTGGQ